MDDMGRARRAEEVASLAAGPDLCRLWSELGKSNARKLRVVALETVCTDQDSFLPSNVRAKGYPYSAALAPCLSRCSDCVEFAHVFQGICNQTMHTSVL